MIEIERVGEVVKIRMANRLFGRPLYYTAAYWVDGLLIDTGCPRTSQELLSVIEELGLERIVNTHSHEDHIGGNAILQERLRVETLAHPLALPILSDPKRLHLQLYRRFIWGSPAPSQGSPVGEVITTGRNSFRVIPTPGHSEDHISLHEPHQGWLFSGDAYIGGVDKSLQADSDIYAIIASLKRLSTLPAKRLFQGSGTVRDDPQEAIEKKAQYLEELGQKVRRLHNQGLRPKEIRDRLLGRELPIAYWTLGHFSGLNLVRSYLKVKGEE
jgi:glyoxylase-like metal-dependent hydrolase (beta-lactamase superfamily II)